MYRAGEPAKRPPPGPAPPRVRSVEVARGRAGYGFTLSGQAPCVLSGVVRGSPADFVGLRAGDQIFAINEINVKKASHEDVVKLIGKCSGVLRLAIGEGAGHPEACSSDDEGGLCEGKGWLRPKLDSKALGINRAERVVEEMQSGGIFSMIFENPNLCMSGAEPLKGKQRSLSESAAVRLEDSPSTVHPGLLSKEVAQAVHDDSVFSAGPENPDSFVLDASILNVAMVVGYLGSIELPSTSSNLESDSLQAIRGCMRRLRAEQKIHSLVTMKVMHDRVLLCSDKACVVAEYPAEKLAFSAVCPDDRRFFGLVTMQTNDDGSLAQGEEGALRTSCHVFMVDPDLFHHKIHQGIARRFGFVCTADPDTSGCLEFPASSLPVLQFISVLYRDMGELIEGVRARAFLDGDGDAHQNNSTSSTSDSGIGNFSQEEKSSRVLVVDLGGGLSRPGLGSSAGWEGAGARSSQAWATSWSRPFCHSPEGGAVCEAGPQADRLRDPSKHLGPASHAEGALASLRSSVPPSKRGAGAGCGLSQRWLPVHVLQEWQCGHASDQESYTDSTDGWSSVNCGTLPPPMSKIPADRYRVEGSFAQAPLSTQKRDWARKAFGMQNLFGPPRNVRKTKEDKKGSKFGRGIGLVQTSQRTSARRSFGRSKRFSITRSLDDLESATVSDGELTGADLKDCVSSNSLSSNASLPSVQSCRRLRERRVASWAVSFERLLQDPVGVRYFSDFLRKEFSEENILFWQACEYFNHVPAHDKKELSYRAREIFSKFLCSKATTPVNIDSQAQLADDILNAPHPDMFKEQQLQALPANGGLCRRESQGSVSSAGSLDLPEACRTLVPEKDKAVKHCCIHLPDGTSCVVAVKSGFSIKEILSGLCERHGINGAAVDLFLVGGDKPLVLHQDSSILASRDLRLEKRTLFRLDLVPINRSVGLKAKPTKPVTEVLRPVVAKYGLDLGSLLVRLSGEKEPLDLGAPISSLDGQRVVLEERDPTRGRAPTDKQKGTPAKPSAAASSRPRDRSATGEERTLGKSNSIKIKGENGKNARDPRLSKREESIAKIGKKKYQKINLDEAEEFFELISKAQSSRADDQRGLLRKEDLVLPEFLRLPPGSTELALCALAPAKGFSKRPETTGHGREKASPPSDSSATSPGSAQSSGSAQSPCSAQSPGSVHSLPGPPGATPPGQKVQEGTTQVWRRQSREVEAGGIQTEDESGADLTLVGEGDISSPNSTLLPPPPSPQDALGPPRAGGRARGSQGLPVNRIFDVDLVAGAAPGVWPGPGRARPVGAPVSDRPGQNPSPGEPKAKSSTHHATFV
uniref:Regulator of G-protein signaling 12 n=1 Tax=Chinchilla lanigera TaxID=34839 RepID=A0A8C2VD31_CHILA